MDCIYCRHETKVVNSRPQKKTNQIWRRRHCEACGSSFTSIEAADYAQALRVAFPGGHFEPFSRDRLLMNIYDACRHRKNALKDAQGLAATTIHKLFEHIDHATLTRRTIVETTAKTLKRFDNAAYVQYQAYHPVETSKQ